MGNHPVFLCQNIKKSYIHHKIAPARAQYINICPVNGGILLIEKHMTLLHLFAIKGGMLSSRRGVVVLCSPEAFKAIKFHPSMLTLVNHGVLPDSNLFNASVKASLPAFQAMTVDGLTFVNTGLLYRDFIPAGQAFMVPVFGANNLVGSDLQPFECYHGPASRDARLAAEEAESLFFQYGWEDHLHNQTIQSEYGLLPICYNQSMITRLTVNTSEG